METNIEETFQIQAPIDAVWEFLMDPHRVVVCMPGAELEQITDDNSFLGNVKLKVGFVTVSYKGRVQFTEVDQQSYLVRLEAQGQETTGGGGTAKGTMSSRLQALPDGGTEVKLELRMDITGRMIEFGRGMIRSVSRQLIQQFVTCAKQQLETPEATAPDAGTRVEEGPSAVGETKAEKQTKPIAMLPLVLHVLGASVGRFFRRLFGRSAE